MAFLDASVVLALVIKTSVHHDIAVQFFEQTENQVFYLSPIAICEMGCAISRMINGGQKLVGPVARIFQQQGGISPTALTSAVFSVLYKSYSVVFCGDNEVSHLVTISPLSYIPSKPKLLKLYAVALQYAPILKLKTLDTLHLVYVKELSVNNRYPCQFVTLDTDFRDKKDTIRNCLGVDIICLL